MTIFAWIVAALVCLFTVRRAFFWASSLLPGRADTPARDRSVVVLVAAHDEERLVGRLLAALDRIDYPAPLLRFVVASDGSRDATAAILDTWAAGRADALPVILPDRRGKAAALQAALGAAPESDLVVVCDADTVPEPGAIAMLVGAFADERVGGACGYPDPGTIHETAVARYAALERWVSHLVTFAGKDRLALHPPVIGALFCLRRSALAAIGGFPVNTVAEDIHISLALSRAGWRTRWIGGAVTREDVPTDLAAFTRQRLRWSRGLLASGKQARGVEEVIVAAGYLDRIAFASAVMLAMLGRLPLLIPVVYCVVPVIVMTTALSRAGIADRSRYFVSIFAMFFVDLGVTLNSVLAQLLARPHRWRR